jgi:hypothetical protein
VLRQHLRGSAARPAQQVVADGQPLGDGAVDVFWLKASLAAPNTTISSGLADHALHHGMVVGHLRHPLGADVAGDFDFFQACSLQTVNQFHLDVGGHRLLSFCKPSRGPTSISPTREGMLFGFLMGGLSLCGKSVSWARTCTLYPDTLNPHPNTRHSSKRAVIGRGGAQLNVREEYP